jgi:hypothetical protein
MIFLYSFLLLFLGAIKMLIDRRVVSLERKYAKTALAADRLSRETLTKEGNSRSDPCQGAKRLYLLGLLVQKRDRLEAKHEAWQESAERFHRLVTRLRDWKGKKLPYTLGVVDVSFVLYLIDYFGVGRYVDLRHLSAWLVSLFSR